MEAHRRNEFTRWLFHVTPLWTWDWNYQAYVQQHLYKVTTGEIKRLMLFMPPRHGKSEMVTVRYPVWRLDKDPETKIIIGAYNQTLAEKFSRKARGIARGQVGLSKDRQSAQDWETDKGGGMRAAGVGTGITGHGGDLIVIDDPVKSRQEARSLAKREATWNWYTDDLYTRLEPGGAMILIMTRWHEDDLAGRILASEDGPNWTVISLPAFAEDNDPIGRKVGEALNPERYPVVELERIKMAIGSRSFTGLFQQRPQEQEGGMFKRSWFEIVKEVPADARRLRYWDFAATQDGGAFTAGVKMAAKDGIFYIEDVVRGQWETGERNRIMLQTATLDNQKHHTPQHFEEEGGSSGKDAAKMIFRLLLGFSVHADRVTGDKVLRAEPLSSQAEGLNVKIKKASWNQSYIDELTSFPLGTFMDQTDGTSGAFNELVTDGPLILFEV